jgi:hypothetical protein
MFAEQRVIVDAVREESIYRGQEQIAGHGFRRMAAGLGS